MASTPSWAIRQVIVLGEATRRRQQGGFVNKVAKVDDR
jgi:hypothetical protein